MPRFVYTGATLQNLLQNAGVYISDKLVKSGNKWQARAACIGILYRGNKLLARRHCPSQPKPKATATCCKTGHKTWAQRGANIMMLRLQNHVLTGHLSEDVFT